ncbi:MAG: choline-sulfatase, partial [Gammaproteobacteria bacterium]|nr:choline-sulfatase [Gammaproteobacteria bacterium]
MATGRPNILIIMADQLAPQFLPAYGHPVVKAPHIDGLAQQGVVFDAAYCNAPLCAPARYVFMSGRLPTNIAAWDNACEFSAEIPTYAHYLSYLGYRTALSGKMHFCGPDQLHGFDQRLTTDVYPADFTWTPDWDAPERPLDWYHNMDVVRTAGQCLRSSYLDYDDEVAFMAQRYLFECVRDREAQPFCLTVSFIHPHDPYITRPECWSLYRDADIDMPAITAEDVDLDPHARRLRDAMGMHENISAAQVRNARRAYYGSTSYIDAKIGELLQALQEAGVADNTVIIVTSDHGDMLGERGLWFKMNWFENSARVPLIVHAPGRFGQHRVSQAVSHIDLLPTLVDLASDGAGVDYPTPIDGRSLLPHLTGQGGHDEAIGEYCAEGTSTPCFMIRRGAWKLIAASGDPLQLYRLDDDPLETRNLAHAIHDDLHSAAMLQMSQQRWDVAALRARIIESQRRRRFLAPVMRDQGVSWDYQPSTNAAASYIR